MSLARPERAPADSPGEPTREGRMVTISVSLPRRTAIILQRRPHPRVELLPRLGEAHAARGAVRERHAEPPLEPAERLAHRRRSHAEPVAGPFEAPRLRQCDEDGHRIQVLGHPPLIVK